MGAGEQRRCWLDVARLFRRRRTGASTRACAACARSWAVAAGLAPPARSPYSKPYRQMIAQPWTVLILTQAPYSLRVANKAEPAAAPLRRRTRDDRPCGRSATGVPSQEPFQSLTNPASPVKVSDEGTVGCSAEQGAHRLSWAFQNSNREKKTADMSAVCVTRGPIPVNSPAAPLSRTVCANTCARGGQARAGPQQLSDMQRKCNPARKSSQPTPLCGAPTSWARDMQLESWWLAHARRRARPVGQI